MVVWMVIWMICLVAALVAFSGMALLVSVGGALDIVRMLRRLNQSEEDNGGQD